MGSKLCYSDTQSASLPSAGGSGGGLTWPGRGVEEVHGEEEMHKRSARSRHVWSWRGEFRRKPDDGCIGRTQPDWHQTAGTRAAPGGWPHHPLATDLNPPGNVAPWPQPEGTVVFSSFTTDILVTQIFLVTIRNWDANKFSLEDMLEGWRIFVNQTTRQRFREQVSQCPILM